MIQRQELIEDYHSYINGDNVLFEEVALKIFKYQSINNPVYNQFLRNLKINVNDIGEIDKIPFLPVSLFKKYQIKTGDWDHEKVFESSATSGLVTSKYYVRSLDFYLSNAQFCFEESLGNLEEYCFIALLPSYLERNTSSLIYMVDSFIKKSGCGDFYRYEYNQILNEVKKYQGEKKIVLLGVTFALLEMAEKYPSDLSEVIIMETGGMKGRGRELPRDEVHDILKKGFNVKSIYSEYGMTELLSQAYSFGEGVFKSSKTMKIIFKDIYDPFESVKVGSRGKINIIDIANIDTCSFLSTDDLGVSLGKDLFKVLGRTDESDIRGCNLLYL